MGEHGYCDTNLHKWVDYEVEEQESPDPLNRDFRAEHEEHSAMLAFLAIKKELKPAKKKKK